MSSSTMKCPECPYDKLRNLGTHLFFVHGYSKHRITLWRMNMKSETLSRTVDADGNCAIFRCGFCPKTYKRQNSCRAHERVVHCVTSSSRQKRVPCPIRNCPFVTTALLDLCAHAKEAHSEMGDYSIREARFENMALFQNWRMEYEESTQSVLATESVNSNAAAGTTLRYLRCAQLEAEIRKVRHQKRLQAETSEAVSELDEEEVLENEMEETVPPASPTPSAPPSAPPADEAETSVPSRPVRKRKMGGPVGYDMREDEKECGSIAKKEKEGEEEEELQEEVNTGEDEEEEIDVEQLDEGEEANPPVSSSLLTKKNLPAKPNNEKKKDVSLPRLIRESSAHLDQDEIDVGEQDPSMRPNYEEDGEKRMNSKHCTAHMRVLVLRSGAVHVEYCNSHLGHDIHWLPPTMRSSDQRVQRRTRVHHVANTTHKTTWERETEEAIEMAKQRRKGRRETEHRWRTENRMKTERDAFTKLCNRYDDIGANVELYEMGDEEEVYEEVEILPIEVVEEEEVVHHEEQATSSHK